MKFIGRQSELQTLEQEYHREGGFVVIYGRRRVGKTRLIKEFIKDTRLLTAGSASEKKRFDRGYASLKFEFLPCVVASIVAMVFLRRICSSRPGDWEQRRQSVAALTARGRGLDCL